MNTKRMKRDGVYEAQPELQRHMMVYGVTTAEVAKLWGDAPSTARGRLTGHAPITPRHKLQLAKLLLAYRDRELESRR